MPNLAIVLRQSPDWGSITDAEFRVQSRAFCALVGRPPEQVNQSVDLWDATFARSFLDIRREIKEISLANFSAVADAEIESLRSDVAPDDLGKNFYLFTDDDDWLHPELGTRLAPSEPPTPGVVWGSAAFGTTTRAAIVKRDVDGFCYTNNYAIAGAHLRSNPGDYPLVSQHGGANTLLDAHGSRIVDQYWSITNKHPLSTVYMEQVLTGIYESDRLRRAVEDYVLRCNSVDFDAHPDLAWARPLMERTTRVFAALL